MGIFGPADILLPDGVPPEQWAVIACDQFTSQPEYWHRVRERVGDAPSSLHLILPEAELGASDASDEARAREIHETMARYLASGLLRAYPNAMVYVERTLLDGRVRRGIVGKLDLEAYDYRDGSASPVRASERTVVERIPPRKRVRRGALLELPHVLLLCDDERRALIEPLAACREERAKLYDFDLMEGGGRLAGWLVQGGAQEAFLSRLADYEVRKAGVAFAVGDGNHSLAAAKACYEDEKRAVGPEKAQSLPTRYALVELENLRDEAQTFEPIHRIVRTGDPKGLLAGLIEAAGAEDGYPVGWRAGEESGRVFLSREKGPLPVGILQAFLDEYARTHPCEIDYIHGEDALRALSRQAGTIGFELPPVDKAGLFPGIARDGALPRKAFSMGRAQEKRYYMEARRLR